MITEGENAVDFTLPGTAGEEITQYELTDYTEEGAVVLAFYPFDFSPVCTYELCQFRETEWLGLTENVDVFGVSLDSCYAHKRFIREYDLPFPLLSDSTGEVTASYGLDYDEWEHHSGVSKRALVTIDASDTVRYVWKAANAYENPTLDELNGAVTALDGVAP